MVGIDGSTLEANAAMRSIVRRDNGDNGDKGPSYEEFLKGLAQLESGIPTPTREDLSMSLMAKRKNPAAVQLGRRGAKARMSKMTPEQRSEVGTSASGLPHELRQSHRCGYSKSPPRPPWAAGKSIVV